MKLRIAVPVVVLASVILFAIFGSFANRHAWDASALLERNLPPAFLGGTSDHLLGTDRLGRDVLQRLVVGARISLGLAFLGTLIGAVLGAVLGLIAARSGRMVDGTILALVDFQASIPFMIVALAALAIFGTSPWIFIGLLGIYGWESYCRLVRNNALSTHTLAFVDAARVGGASPAAIDRRHILPAVASVIIVQATLNFPQTILLETGLSFLGLGIQPPLTSLGQLLGEGRDSLARAWWVAVMPGLLIVLTTLAVSLLGDELRDRLDPRLRGR